MLKISSQSKIASVSLLLIALYGIFVGIDNINRPIRDSDSWRQSEIYSDAYKFAYKDNDIFNPKIYFDKIYEGENIILLKRNHENEI